MKNLPSSSKLISSLVAFSLTFLVLTIKVHASQPSGNWTLITPSNYQVNEISVDPNNSSIIYIATNYSGIFKSTDGGTSWNSINNGFPNVSSMIFTDIAIDPNNPNLLYTGAFKDEFAPQLVGGIFKSTDGGATWTNITNNIGAGIGILDLTIDPVDHSLYAALYHNRGVWKTINGGSSWSTSTSTDAYRVLIDKTNHNIIYAGVTSTGGNIIKSMDGANSWSSAGQGIGFVGAVRGIAINPNNPNIIYAGVETNGIYKSTDGANSWTFLPNSPQYEIARTLITDPIRPNTVYAGAERVVFQSSDGGNTWVNISNGLPNVRVNSLFIPANNPNVMYAATSLGVYRLVLNSSELDLNVPYFSQNDLPWGPTEYDSASGKLSDPTIDRWGCVVTSVAMILKYHKIDQLLDGTLIDPGSLNQWLKQNRGYITGYKNMDGFYSYFNWPIIGTLTKKLFAVGKSNTKLEHRRQTSNTQQILNNDLNIEKFPDILQVKNINTSSHFVVAKGTSNNTYSINDPEWNYPTLESFNNSYTQVDRYIPSNTNLSYLVAVINPSVELLVTNPQDQKTGKNFYNGQLQELNEINNASYSFQAPISNPNDSNELENLGTGVNEFLLPEPENGRYEIKLSSKKTGVYEINIATFEKEGNDDLNKIRGIIRRNKDEIITINYSQDKASEINKIVTPQSLIDDLNDLKNLNLINNDGIYNSLLAKVAIFQTINSINKNTSKNILNALLNELDAQRGRNITEDAYQILFYDANYLKNNL